VISLATTVEATAVAYLTAAAGSSFELNANAQALAQVPAISIQSVTTGAASPEIMEQSLALSYPVFAVYCDKISNTLKEKFRTFSGTAQLTIDVRFSQDQIGGIQTALENYVSATCEVFDGARGDWGNGLFYRGGYEVSLTAVKKGGKGFLQLAKITLEIDVSI
jgi:hypothetical protein